MAFNITPGEFSDLLRDHLPIEFIRNNNNRAIAAGLRAVGFTFGNTPFGTLMRELRSRNDRRNDFSFIDFFSPIPNSFFEIARTRRFSENYRFIVELEIHDIIDQETFIKKYTFSTDTIPSPEEILDHFNTLFTEKEQKYGNEWEALDFEFITILNREGAFNDYDVSQLVDFI